MFKIYLETCDQHIFTFFLPSILSQFDSNILQLLGIPGWNFSSASDSTW